EMIPGTEARMCLSQSHKYHGACWHDHNCAMVCRNEGFSGEWTLEVALLSPYQKSISSFTLNNYLIDKIASLPKKCDYTFDLGYALLLNIPDDSPGAVRRLLGPWIVLPTKKNRLEGDPRPEPRDPPSDGQVRIV
nr:defensin-like protein 1 [Tanacetum cinerariifolium]